MDSLDHFEKCFSNVSIKELNERIQFFKTIIHHRSLPEHIARAEIRKVFRSNLDQIDIFFFLTNDILTRKYDLSHFFRIRKFEKEDYEGLHSRIFHSMKEEQDAWWIPPTKVSWYGRLNRPKESILYVSKELSNAVYEKRLEPQECFFAMVYQSKKTMRMAQLQNITYMDDLSELGNAKRILMHNFLQSEFTKIIPDGSEHQYLSSILIYEDFFKHDNLDGFSYPSIASKIPLGFNVAFPINKAKENLTLIGIMVLRLEKNTRESEFCVSGLFDGFFDQKEGFTFLPFNCEEAKKRLGGFALARSMGF